MKTYKATIEKPVLVISHDSDAESPREWSNLGYFITVDRNYKSPDDYNGTIYNIVKRTSEEASDLKEHMAMIKKAIKEETGEKVLAIYPVVKYEHSAVVYRLGEQHGFDYSNNGFYIVTDKTVKETGTKKPYFEKVISQELETYTQWANGEVYGFTLYDEQGTMLDSCSGFYSLEDIKDSLPEEWKNEKLEEYLK